MRVSYKKLWIKLAEKEISRADLRKIIDIAPSTMTKLNKNELVALSVLVKICNKLGCDIGDIMEVVPEEAGSN